LLLLLLSDIHAQDCQSPGTCSPPKARFLRVMPVTSRLQWTYSGGFCGALSIQSIALSYGAWISQTLIRKAAPDGGGHGDPDDGYEVLHTNIEPALNNLKMTFAGWPYHTTQQPQSNSYLAWLKKELCAGHPIVWFIMCSGDNHNTYGLARYDHIEPVFGIFSNHSLSDPTVYADDILVHGSDWDQNRYYRPFNTLVDSAYNGNVLTGNCSIAVPYGGGPNEAYPCVMRLLDYGWSILGLVDPLKRSIPTSVEMSDQGNEPSDPTMTDAQITVYGLQPGVSYVTYRFDGTDTFPTDSQYEKGQYTNQFKFTASSSTYSFWDPAQIDSSTAVYYATVKLQ